MTAWPSPSFSFSPWGFGGFGFLSGHVKSVKFELHDCQYSDSQAIEPAVKILMKTCISSSWFQTSPEWEERKYYPIFFVL